MFGGYIVFVILSVHSLICLCSHPYLPKNKLDFLGKVLFLISFSSAKLKILKDLKQINFLKVLKDPVEGLLGSLTKKTNEKPLRKHAYSNTLKILPPKTESFQIKILIFFIFLLKI